MSSHSERGTTSPRRRSNRSQRRSIQIGHTPAHGRDVAGRIILYAYELEGVILKLVRVK